MSNAYYSQPSPSPSHQPLQPGAGSVEVRRSEFEPVFVGDIWAKRVLLGAAALFIVWCLAAVVYDYNTRVTCVQLEQDKSFGCRIGYRPCQPPTSKPCPKEEDYQSWVQLGADIAQSNFERGRENLFPWALKLAAILILNLAGVRWVAEHWCGVRLINDLWMSLLWSSIAVAPEMYFASATPMYTDVTSTGQMFRGMASAVNPFSYLSGLFWALWPVVASYFHLQISVRGTQAAMIEARVRMDWAAELAQRGLTAASNTVSALRTTANTIRETANTTYDAVTSTRFAPVRQPVGAELPPLPPLSPLPKPHVNWDVNTIYADPSPSLPVASAPTRRMYSSPSRSQWDNRSSPSTSPSYSQPMMYTREGQMLYT